jgi:hypothetical protein
MSFGNQENEAGNNFLENYAHNVVWRTWLFLFLRKLMRNRLRQTIVALISFWLIFTMSLATCLAGISACPDCSAVPTCCVGMDGKVMSGTGGSADHLPGPNACDHERICADCLSPSDVGAVHGRVQFAYSPSLFQQIFSVQTIHYETVIAPVFPEPSLENFPPLFLQNCSFLI